MLQIDPEGRLEPHCAHSLFSVQPTEFLRALPHRETFHWSLDGKGVIIKRTVGDLARDRWYEILHGRQPRSPAEREYKNLVGLHSAGFHVPFPHGWAVDGQGHSLVVMEAIDHEFSLAELLETDPGRTLLEQGPGLLRILTGLHRAGWYHRDLYLEHLVVDPKGRLVLLDLGRARREPAPRQRWFFKDLAALAHSAPADLSRATRLRFLRDYLRLMEKPQRAQLRRWARQVEAKRIRLAAHQPRFTHQGR